MIATAWDDGLTTAVTVVGRDAAPIVALPFVRDQCLRITNGNAEDEFLDHAIRAATEYGELYMERAISQQLLTFQLSQFPARQLRLPFPPFLQLDGINYLDIGGASQTVNVADVRIVMGGRVSKASLFPMHGKVWPAALGEPGSVAVQYQAGYSDPAQIPRSILQGIILVVGELYKNREQSAEGAATPTVLPAEKLWNGWKVYTG